MINKSLDLLLATFKFWANFRYKRIFSGLLIIWGLAGSTSGWYLIWRQTQVPLCPAVSQEKLPPALSQQLKSSIITVDLSGAVQHPGLYEVSSSARLAEVLALANGFSSDVDQLYVAENLNLASELIDGQKIFVPFKSSTAQNSSEQVDQNETAVSTSSLNCISINTASQTELMSLAGVGEVRADKIIQNRPYSSIDELVIKEVLTEKLLVPISALICL